MDKNRFKIKSKVWQYPGMAGWHFANVDERQSKVIKQLFGGISGGFGSLPVIAAIGKNTWKTSIFFDKKSQTYLLPLKAQVRKKEGIKDGDMISFMIVIRL